MRVFLAILGYVFFSAAAQAQDFGLDAPDSVGMRDAFAVGWTAPQAKGGLIEIRPVGENARRVAYAYTTRNPQSVEAPEAPGDYVLVLSFDGEDRASRPLRVDPATATLSAPATADAGAAVVVGWDGPNNRSDHVTFAHPGGDPIRGAAYAYVGSSKGGTVSLRAPEDAGSYDIVYVSGKTVLARAPIAVGGISATLAFAPKVEAGAQVTVGFEGPDNAGDVITFASRDGDPIRPASYAYTGNARDGQISLRAPADAGSYDIVYISGGRVIGRAPIAVGGISATLAFPPEVPAGARLAVEFEGPDNAGDFITFASRDGDPIRPASYAYTGNARDGQVSLRAFEETGAFDVVYVSGSRVIGRAPVEIVPVSIEIAAPQQVPALQVFAASWRGTGNQGDRIAMVAPGDSDGSPYAYIDPLDETVTMTAPAAEGGYELVYITRGGKELARRAITVTPAPVDPGQIEVRFTPGAGFGPDDAVEIILDASGSMLQRQNGERRIEIARRTLARLVADTIPAGTGFALRVFGNREADACRSDLEIPLGPLDVAAASAVINAITAVNLARTPIADSVAMVPADLAGVRGSRMLILITDGEETCDGDPGQAIEALRAGGLDVRVNIVGYAIDDADLARTFQAWASAGGGSYFDAADGEQLGAALLRSTAAPFRIIDDKGMLVGAGLAGDAPLTLPAGVYTVRIAGKELSATVQPKLRTVVTP